MLKEYSRGDILLAKFKKLFKKKKKNNYFKVVSLYKNDSKINYRLIFSWFSSFLVTITAMYSEQELPLFNIFPFSYLPISFFFYTNWRIWKSYFNAKERESNSYDKLLRYFIKANGYFQVENRTTEKMDYSGNIKKENYQVIVSSAELGYWENQEKIIIRAYKNADKYTETMSRLDSLLSALIRKDVYEKNDTITHCDYIFLVDEDKRLYLSDMPKSRGTTINVTERISYDIASVAHALTIGGTGSGKSFFINSKILDYARMGADIRIADPKSADLSLLRFIDGWENKVATEPNQIAKQLREMNELMENRYRTLYSDTSAFGKTFTDFEGVAPVVLIFDEFTAFIKSLDKKLHSECMSYLYNIIMKGRAAGVFVEIIMQRPDASALDGAIRDQLGARVALGNLSRQGYEMVFGSSEVEYRSITEKGGGYIKIDGLHNEPVYFETPFLAKDFDFIEELKKYT